MGEWGKAVRLTTVKVGDRFKAQPYTQMAFSRGSSRPVKLPYAVPATVTAVTEDGALGPEYVVGVIDSDLYGHRPWQSDQQLWILSRGELHAMDCRCPACE